MDRVRRIASKDLLRAQQQKASLHEFEHLLVGERRGLILDDGHVRLYRLPNGYGLNAINASSAYRFKYAWEFAVLEPDPDDVLGFGDVVFDTPLTDSVKVCLTEEEAATFLRRAIEWATKGRDE